MPELSPKRPPNLVEVTKAETTRGWMTGGTISISADFRGELCEAHLDAYIERLTSIRDKIRKWKSSDGQD